MRKAKPAAAVSTTLKLPAKLKGRLTRLARKRGRTPHGLMLEAIEREVRREEGLEAFVREALAADRDIDQGGEVYAAADVHTWLRRLATDSEPARPKPWRG